MYPKSCITIGFTTLARVRMRVRFRLYPDKNGRYVQSLTHGIYGFIKVYILELLRGFHIREQNSDTKVYYLCHELSLV